MDEQGHGQPPVVGVVQYISTPFQATPLIGATPGSVAAPVGTIQSPSQSTAYAASTAQLAQQHIQQQQQQQQLNQQLHIFWGNQYQEVEQANDFKNHSLPLARIKKIMKADEDVRMITAEAPVVFAKACEMFILELTLRSWNHTEENKRRTLQKNDIAAAITRTDIFYFLVDIVPREELKDEVLGALPRGGPGPVGAPADAIPYYYTSPQPAAQGVGKPVVEPNVYVQMWQQPQQQPGEES